MNTKMWLKRVLIPFWTIELIFLLVILVFSGIRIAYFEENEYGYLSTGSVILVAFAGTSVIFDITAIILFARHKLSPVTYLVFQCISAAMWITIFLIEIVQVAYGYRVTIGFFFIVVLVATSVGQMAYASVIMHRKRRGLYSRGKYAGVETGGLGYQGYESPPRGSYAGYNPHGAPPNPFRDPSLRTTSPNPEIRVPVEGPSAYSTQPEASTAMHPAFRKSGEADSYYGGGGDIGAAQHSYEMQGTAYREH